MSIVFVSYAQNTAEKRIILNDSFTGIVAGGASNVHYIKGDDYGVVIKAPGHVIDKIKVKIKGEDLVISTTGNIRLKNHEKIDIFVTAPGLEKIDMSGAASFVSDNTLTGDYLEIHASGAATVDIAVNAKELYSVISGAATEILSGKADFQKVKASGASSYKAGRLTSKTAEVKASGAANVTVNVEENIEYEKSGAADIRILGNPKQISGNGKSAFNRTSVSNTTPIIIKGDSYDDDDTVKVKIGSVNIEVVDDDTVTIRVGNHQLRVDDDGNVKWEHVRMPRFNGHWGGVEMGINGYLTKDFNTDWGKKYDYLNLRYEKSWFINLNLWEQNIAFNKKKTIGMMTGVGMSWNNYRFSNSTYLKTGQSELEGYYMVSKSYYDPDSIFSNQDLVKKSKLTNMFINVPLLFEFQTGSPVRGRRFHFTVGGIVGFRVATHTKVYFNMANQAYKLEDPATGNYLPYELKTPNNTGRNIVKEHNSFHQPPVKFDTRFGFGYGWLNVFATYGINGMFLKGRGPELHPWTIGLTITGW